MRVFLTGGTGFIGRPLTRALLRRGWEVVALVRKPESAAGRSLARMGARCVPGDVTDAASVCSAMAGADMVVHNAAWYELGVTRRDLPRMQAINVDGTRHVLEAALALGVPRTVYVSSIVYVGDTSPDVPDETFTRRAPFGTIYEETKAKAHDVALDLQARGLPLVIASPGHVGGPNDHSTIAYFIRLYLNGLLPPIGFGRDMAISPAHVDDVAEGIALVAERGRLGENYFLAGEPITIRQIMDRVAAYPGGARMWGYLPNWLALPLMAPLAPVLRWMGLPAFISVESIVASASSWTVSAAKARRELGWTPRDGDTLWREIFEGERALMTHPGRKGIVARLRPVEVDE